MPLCSIWVRARTARCSSWSKPFRSRQSLKCRCLRPSRTKLRFSEVEIDPITIGVAFAGAKAAVATIKEVIKLGKDANELTKSIVGYFDQKAIIEKAEAVKEREKREALWDKANGVKPKKTDAELTSEAMEIVLKRRELERQEYELYEMLVWSGQGKIWDDMVKLRESMRRQIAKEEAEAVKQKIIDAAKAQDRKEMIQDIQLSVAIIAAFGLAMYWLVQWGISKGMWR